MDANSGGIEQAMPRVPQITEADLRGAGMDYAKFGGTVDSGPMKVDSTEIYKHQTEILLSHLNKVFTDKETTKQMLETSKQNVDRLIQKPDLNSSEASELSAFESLQKFLEPASNGDSKNALLMLQRAATNINQHGIVEARSKVYTFMDKAPTYNYVAREGANAFFELSEMLYASKHEGKRYESDAEQQRLEEMKAIIRNINIK